MAKVVAVTGSNGFIGDFLSRRLEQAGHQVIRMARAGKGDVEYDLAMDAWPGGAEADAVVHCAWAYGKGTEDLNLGSCHTLIRHAERTDTRILFISSFSATAAASSSYGRAKSEAAKAIADAGHLVLQAGLVCGRGGLFQRLYGLSARLPLVPLPGYGRQPIQPIAASDLADAVLKAIDEGMTGHYKVASPEPLSLKELFMEMASHQGRKPGFVPLPVPLFRAAVILQHRAGLSSFSAENLDGILGSYVRDNAEDMALLGLPVRSLHDTLFLDMV